MWHRLSGRTCGTDRLTGCQADAHVYMGVGVCVCVYVRVSVCVCAYAHMVLQVSWMMLRMMLHMLLAGIAQRVLKRAWITLHVVLHMLLHMLLTGIAPRMLKRAWMTLRKVLRMLLASIAPRVLKFPSMVSHMVLQASPRACSLSVHG